MPGVSLPIPLTSLVGREREVADVTALLAEDAARLVTLTGAGGIGKTRLALQVAAACSATFAAGAVFVPLSSINRPDLVLSTTARALHLQEYADRPLAESLAEQLAERELLLVLDNFEHVVAAAPLVTELLSRCPALRVLVTSRVVLRVQGEQEYPVPPLSLPERGRGRTWAVPPAETLGDFSAVALFVQRARAAQPAFALTAENALAVTEICSRLDGLPLAIELAAARTKVLPPGALLTRLAHSLNLLTGGARDQPERLQTMRQAIGWSYDLLQPAEQALFRRLAVFAGGFTLEMADEIAGISAFGLDLLDGVASLVDQSLLQEAHLPDGQPRFAMLETIREYGLEQLAAAGEAELTHAAHAAAYLVLAEQAAEGLFGADSQRWLEVLDLEHDNLRAAMTWTARQQGQDLARFTTAMSFFWVTRGHYVEAMDWYTRAIELSVTPSPALARSLGAAGSLAVVTGQHAKARGWTDDAVRVARATGDTVTLGIALYCKADVTEEVGDMTEAPGIYAQAAAAFRAIGSQAWLAMTLANAGAVEVSLNREDAGLLLLDEALALSRAHGFEWGIGISTVNLGRIALQRNDFVTAQAYASESLRIWRKLGDQLRIYRLLQRLATIAAAVRQPLLAARLLGCAEAQVDQQNVARTAGGQRAYAQAIALIAPQLSQAALTAALDEGRALPLDDAIDLALAFTLDAAPDQPSPTQQRSRLSAREQDVLQLVVAGYTDRQIADALFISHRTAQGHVASIFNKFGVNSRTAAATVALREGLVPAEPPAG